MMLFDVQGPLLVLVTAFSMTSLSEDARMVHARLCYDLWKNQNEDIPHPFPNANTSALAADLPRIRRVNLDSLPHRFFIFPLPDSILPSPVQICYDLLIFFHGFRGNVYNQLALTNLSSY
jgi:hypothetical protein